MAETQPPTRDDLLRAIGQYAGGYDGLDLAMRLRDRNAVKASLEYVERKGQEITAGLDALFAELARLREGAEQRRYDEMAAEHFHAPKEGGA